MDRPSPDWLEQIILVLREHGVAMAKIADVEIVLEQAVPDLPMEKPTKSERAPRSAYDYDALYPDGEKPGFTKVK